MVYLEIFFPSIFPLMTFFGNESATSLPSTTYNLTFYWIGDTKRCNNPSDDRIEMFLNPSTAAYMDVDDHIVFMLKMHLGLRRAPTLTAPCTRLPRLFSSSSWQFLYPPLSMLFYQGRILPDRFLWNLSELQISDKSRTHFRLVRNVSNKLKRSQFRNMLDTFTTNWHFWQNYPVECGLYIAARC